MLLINGGEKYDIHSRRTSIAEFHFGGADCSDEEAIMLDQCWVLANQLTTANPAKAKLNVKARQIDFNFEIDNGNVSLSIDGNDQTAGNEIASIENIEKAIHEECIEERLTAVQQELDRLKDDALTENMVIDNYLDNVKEHNKLNKRLSFGLDDETLVFYKSCSETSSSSSEELSQEDIDYEKERMSRLDILKDQLMSTLRSPEYVESGEGDVVEICAQIEEEISLSRRALSVVSEYSENTDEPEGEI